MSVRKTSTRDASNFAAGRTSRAIIASASLLAIALVGGKWIDEYLTLSRDAAQMHLLQAEFDEAHQRRERLLSIEKRLGQQLEQIQKRSVGPEDIERIRQRLIGIVRDAGTSLRRLEIGENEVRPWSTEHDDPRKDTAPLYGESSAFVLHKHAVQVQADGKIESIAKVLQQINNCGWLMSTKSLLISPTGAQNSLNSIEVTLILYGLEPAPESSVEENEEFAMRADQRQFR
jgi:hypothetical protein